MPLYEYRCTACGHVFEKIQSFSDPDPAGCSKCGSPVERLLSAPAIQFKGSGFYLTDYGKAGAPSAKSEGKPESGGASKSDAGSNGGGSPAPAAAPQNGSSPGSTAAPAAASSTPSPAKST